MNDCKIKLTNSCTISIENELRNRHEARMKNPSIKYIDLDTGKEGFVYYRPFLESIENTDGEGI